MNHYELLGINPDADVEGIKAAYYEMSMLYHPRANEAKNASVIFEQINIAYKTLLEPESRKKYDLSI